MVTADNFGAASLYKINEGLVAVSGESAFQIHLNKHGVAAVACGTEPDLTQSFLENMQVLFFELFKDVRHHFGAYPGVADLSYPTSKVRRGRVQNGGAISPTLTTTGGLYVFEEFKSK